ncbi:MAG: GTP cyclohydrolase FolE2 [Bacteriovoracaceae bacterium]|jgi:GTP cyclohydrolase I|nr:GTP cyclohydrolase FolE2 [Bacteriovoracaceae bacterium]
MIEQNYSDALSVKNKVVTDIMACDLKDDSGLNDFQKLPTEDLIAIPRVGINNFKLPVTIKNKAGELRSHDCTASMFVNLNANKNGVSMSRLCTILQQESINEPMGVKLFSTIIERYRNELKDEGDDDIIESAHLKLAFSFPVKQKSLKSDNWGWQYYPCELTGSYRKDKGFEFFIALDYKYSSTCPCSLSMAKQYEREFASGMTKEGSGIGVPHSQRSNMKCKAKIDTTSNFMIEDLIELLRTAIPTETQSLVKRVDEQAFAILNGAHPMFVEHASKRTYKVLNSEERILDWIVQLEHLESLHSHNAAAVIYKGVQNGLSADTIF